jgi:hypothetical protein
METWECAVTMGADTVASAGPTHQQPPHCDAVVGVSKVERRLARGVDSVAVVGGGVSKVERRLARCSYYVFCH